MKKAILAFVLFATAAAMLYAQSVNVTTTLNGQLLSPSSTALQTQLPTATSGKSVVWDDSNLPVVTHPYYYNLDWVRYEDDLGAIINSILSAAYTARVATGSGTTTETYNTDGYGVTIQLPPGRLTLSTSIILDQSTIGSHVHIKGSGFISTSIEVARNIIGFNADGAREFQVSDLRAIEIPGQATKTSILFYLGGSTCKATRVWAGNALYNFMLVGSGGVLDGCVAEEGTMANLEVPSMWFSSAFGLNPAVRNTSNWRISDFHSFNGKINLMTYKQTVLAVSSGTPAIGDTITTSGGATAVPILDVYDNGSGSWTILTERYAGVLIGTANTFTTSGGAAGTVTSHDGSRLRGIQLNGTLMNASTGTPPDYPGLVIESSDGTIVNGLSSRRTFGIELTGNTRLKVANVTETDEAAGLVAVENTGLLIGYDSPTAHSNTGTDTLTEIGVTQLTQP